MGTKKSTPKDYADIELEPDAWERFERAVNVVAKSPPQHRTKATESPKKRNKTDKENG